jgi:hypothetical protein
VNIIAGTLTLILIGVAAAAVFPAWAALTVVVLTAISPHLIALTICVYCGPVLRHPAEFMSPAVDLGGRVWLGSKPCKGGPAAPAFGG